MSKRLDLTDQKFGRLTVLSFDKIENQSTVWSCQCDCGNNISVVGKALKSGTASCGCLRKEAAALQGKINAKHGLTSHKLFRLWTDINYRCHNPDSARYENYGGRGIRVFEEWRTDPTKFFEYIEVNLGPKPLSKTMRYSLNRIDNDKGYEPGNIEWADDWVQVDNRRKCDICGKCLYKGRNHICGERFKWER